jgi:electron-transferring-flavoprotein dehydrogenase
MAAMPIAPSAYPPPFDSSEVIAAPAAAADEQLEVGVAIVGGGPAGLACAIRLAQLLDADPAAAERLGETPIALVDKGRTVGAHQLSGAVVQPAALLELFPGTSLAQMTSYGPVEREAVYLLTRSRAARLPIVPPPMHNKGNHVFSLARLARYMAERAEELGVLVLPETDAQRLLVSEGAVRGIRTGDKGRGRNGEELAAFEPGAELTAQATVLADGVQGMLSGAAVEHFGLEPDNPQIYALGVKEVWRVARPLDRVVHTIGWPLKPQARYREFGGTFAYPMGADTICLGLVVGLDYADASLSVHDLLQDAKTHPLFKRMLEGGERLAWGAKAIPEGGFWSLPASVAPPGAVLLGDAAGFVNVPRLKGVHYALRSGMLAAETIHRALADGTDLSLPGALSLYDAQVRNSEIYHDLRRYRNMRQAFQHGLLVGGALGGVMDTLHGDFPPWRLPTHPDAEQPVFEGKRTYAERDGALTFDKLSSVFASGNRSRDDQPDHLRIQRRVPRELALAWTNLCPAQVYELGAEGDDGLVALEVTPSNCVQCGAITAKGGRLTPPEGGSGPEYTLT